jgi:hypothetical protein
MAKRSDREPAKLSRTLGLEPVSECSAGFANHHQGPRLKSHLQAGYKDAMNPPCQKLQNPLATREASI